MTDTPPLAKDQSVYEKCGCGHKLNNTCDLNCCGDYSLCGDGIVHVLKCSCGAEGDDLWRNAFHAMNVTRCGKCERTWWGWNA